MILAEVEFDDFIAWIGAIEENPKRAREHILRAGTEVPLIGRMVAIHMNALEHGATSEELDRARAVINTLIALYYILDGQKRPSQAQKGHKTTRRKAK